MHQTEEEGVAGRKREMRDCYKENKHLLRYHFDWLTIIKGGNDISRVVFLFQ
jgi:hypothetical protein